MKGGAGSFSRLSGPRPFGALPAYAIAPGRSLPPPALLARHVHAERCYPRSPAAPTPSRAIFQALAPVCRCLQSMQSPTVGLDRSPSSF